MISSNLLFAINCQLLLHISFAPNVSLSECKETEIEPEENILNLRVNCMMLCEVGDQVVTPPSLCHLGSGAATLGPGDCGHPRVDTPGAVDSSSEGRMLIC